MGSGKCPPAAVAVFRDLSAKSALVPFVFVGRLGHISFRFVFHFVPFLDSLPARLNVATKTTSRF
jgi:hypothetical protein